MTIVVELLDWSDARAEARPLRLDVFVVEQKVPVELEWDEWDERSVHAIARVGGVAAGTGRLLPASAEGVVKIGRMAVRRDLRGRGVGAAILAALLDRATHAGARTALLHAQTEAAGFYQRTGFIARGETFYEAGIPHVEMTKLLQDGAAGPASATP
jgi:predicted GNAT family N-acyltransferase